MSEMLIAKVDRNEFDDAATVETPRGNLHILPYISDEAAQVAYEHFEPKSTVVWQYWHDEVHYVIEGKAKITYALAPLFIVTGEITAEAGDVYLIPKGADLKFEIISDEPYRHLCVMMPADAKWLELTRLGEA
jgi:ethanolamine utilization protein EutQ (cupin superfamily)